jgi:transcriptional regulatory protein LevR
MEKQVDCLLSAIYCLTGAATAHEICELADRLMDEKTKEVIHLERCWEVQG